MLTRSKSKKPRTDSSASVKSEPDLQPESNLTQKNTKSVRSTRATRRNATNTQKPRAGSTSRTRNTAKPIAKNQPKTPKTETKSTKKPAKTPTSTARKPPKTPKTTTQSSKKPVKTPKSTAGKPLKTTRTTTKSTTNPVKTSKSTTGKTLKTPRTATNSTGKLKNAAAPNTKSPSKNAKTPSKDTKARNNTKTPKSSTKSVSSTSTKNVSPWSLNPQASSTKLKSSRSTSKPKSIRRPEQQKLNGSEQTVASSKHLPTKEEQTNDLERQMEMGGFQRPKRSLYTPMKYTSRSMRMKNGQPQRRKKKRPFASNNGMGASKKHKADSVGNSRIIKSENVIDKSDEMQLNKLDERQQKRKLIVNHLKDDVNSSNDMSSYSPVGIINAGNTCYSSSVLQVLLNDDTLMKHIASKWNQEDMDAMPTATSLLALHAQRKNKKTSETVEKERELLSSDIFRKAVYDSCIQMEREDFSNAELQQDAQEFLMETLDALSKEVDISQMGLNQGGETYIDGHFEISTLHVYRCIEYPAEKRKYEMERMRTVSLSHLSNVSPTSSSNSPFALSSLLRRSFRGEHILSDCTISPGHTITAGHLHEQLLNNLPRCLIIMIHRFNYNTELQCSERLDYGIDIDNTISLEEYLNPEEAAARESGDEVFEYELGGVIRHLGESARIGHYKAEVKGKDGVWYGCNDEEIDNDVEEERVGDKSAYLLFYYRKQGRNGVQASNMDKSSEDYMNMKEIGRRIKTEEELEVEPW